MPIRHVDAPQESVNEFKSWLAKRKPNTRLLTNRRFLPHRIFHVKLSDIVSGQGFANAWVVAWRHLHTDKQGSTAVETKVDEHGKYLFHEAHSGPMVDEHKDLFANLTNREELQHEEYEHASLRLFALKITAVWLRAADRKNDYFIALPPYFYGLQAGKLYPSDEFIKITQNAIRKLSDKSKAQTEPMRGG
ncbi:hypothetical protein [Spirosoma areae]